MRMERKSVKILMFLLILDLDLEVIDQSEIQYENDKNKRRNTFCELIDMCSMYK
jgi:hypothetical protein